MSVRVAFPVYFATVRLHVEKGRQWNTIEHLLLFAVCKDPLSGAQLAERSNVPVRLAIEVMIRLMRAGWVELESGVAGFRFRATPAGKAIVDKEVLPAITRPASRNGSFAIDRVTGAIFRARDLILYNRYVFTKLLQAGQIRAMSPENIDDGIRQDDIVMTLCDEDEQFKRIDATPSRFGDRFAVVSVIGSSIEGLPPRAPEALRTKILAAAGALVEVTAVQQLNLADQIRPPNSQDLRIKFSPDGFIVGGLDHLGLLKSLLKRARQRIVIHSTFIDVEKFRLIFPLLHDAAKRGVKIDLLWGKANASDGTNPTESIVEACRLLLRGEDVRERITIHGFSTNSHAKLIVADDGKGNFSAIVGSCNWLSTNFGGIEASVRFEDPTIVGELVSILCRMAAGSRLSWTPLTSDLAILAQALKKATPFSSGITVDARVLLGAAHGKCVLVARDEAQRRIFLTSHRFSENADTLVLIPTRAALKARDVEVKLYYGMLDGAGAGGAAASLESRATTEGIRFQQILEPMLHAKVLVWDENSVVVSSQNWLSADPPDDERFSELGVYLSGPNLATELVERLKLAFDRANRY